MSVHVTHGHSELRLSTDDVIHPQEVAVGLFQIAMMAAVGP